MMCRSVLLLAMMALAGAPAQAAPDWDLQADTWVATDGLGRTLPTHAQVGSPRPDRKVGIFFFLWLTGAPTRSGPYDMTKIVATPADDWGPLHAFHHWAEPLWGYYQAEDPAVLRKQVQMLADAGVDVLIFDNTNGLTYAEVYRPLLEVMADMRSQGLQTPEVAAFASASACDKIFIDLYKNGRESWTPGNHINDLDIDKGAMVFRIDGNDSMLNSPGNLGLNAAQYTRIHLRLKNGTAAPTAQFYWSRTTDGGFNGTRVTGIPIGSKQTDYVEVVYDLAGQADWNGTIREVRFDPAGGPAQGDYALDYIAFEGDGVPAVRWDFEGDDHPELWFYWENKPLLLATSGDMEAGKFSAAALNFFTIRKTWGLQAIDEPNEWTFMQHYNRLSVGYTTTPAEPEFAGISVAQQETYMSYPTAHGRSYHNGQEPPVAERDMTGRNLQEQAEWALAKDPQFLFVTGWNEWIAQRFEDANGNTRFVDAYNQEFSRDAEPMKGGHQDHYYYQLASIIRRFKGVRPPDAVTAARTVVIDGQFDEWLTIGPVYRDSIGDPVHRDFPGWGNVGQYVNQSGRNDLVEARLTWDTENVYFYARTASPLTPSSDPGWMQLLIETDGNAANGWQGYDFIVNRSRSSATRSRLERQQGSGWNWSTVADVDYASSGNQIEIAVPRTLLGLTTLPATVDFKWADNTPADGDVMSLTTDGDAAPNGRFSYRYVLDPDNSKAAGWAAYH